MKTADEESIRENVANTGKKEEHNRCDRVKKRVRQGGISIPLINDPMEALGLLFTHSLAHDKPMKRIMPFATLAPPLEGVKPQQHSWLPFIEHRGSSESTTRKTRKPRYWFITPEVADLLRTNDYIELDLERSTRGFVYRISLFGIAVYAEYRKERRDTFHQ